MPCPLLPTVTGPGFAMSDLRCCSNSEQHAISLQLALACVELVRAIDKHDDCCCADHAWHDNTCEPVHSGILSLQAAQLKSAAAFDLHKAGQADPPLAP